MAYAHRCSSQDSDHEFNASACQLTISPCDHLVATSLSDSHTDTYIHNGTMSAECLSYTAKVASHNTESYVIDDMRCTSCILHVSATSNYCKHIAHAFVATQSCWWCGLQGPYRDKPSQLEMLAIALFPFTVRCVTFADTCLVGCVVAV